METGEWTTFDSDELELRLRAVFMEDMPIEIGDEMERHDCFIWFSCTQDGDNWFAFAISDDLHEPWEMIDQSDPIELRKASIFLGHPWDTIINGCPHCWAKRHRASRNNMSVGLHQQMMDCDDEALARSRDTGRFQAQSDTLEALAGIRLSLN